MGITDELRHEVADYPFRDNRDFAIFEAVADRIDAEHERTVGFCKRLEDAAAKREDVEIFGVEYTALPLDADGEPIRVGDVMEGVDKYDSLKKVMGKVITVSFESDGIVDVAIRAWNSDGKSWRRAYLDPDASVYRHYHAPTVEDVLYESLKHFGAVEERTPEVEEWLHEQAAKLRLADDGKEQ